MGNSNTIINCTILHSDREAGRYEAEVMAELSDGEIVKVFSFYDDELRFGEQEFIGRTQQEAIALFHERDIAFLQS